MAAPKLSAIALHMRCFAKILAVFLACFMLPAGQALSNDKIATELKAAFIFNFIRYIEWPEHISQSPSKNIVICINADNDHYLLFEKILAARGIKDRTIITRKTRGPEDIPGCWINFNSSHSELVIPPEEINKGGQGVLTIGEYPRSIQGTDIIRLFIENDKLRFEINITLAKQAKLKISSKLLNLARIRPDRMIESQINE